MKQKISVTRALAELKKTGDQLTRLNSQKFIAVTVGQGDRARIHGSPGTVESVTREIQSAFDQASAIYHRRRALKAALVQSNANTLVTIGQETMTVAEAVEVKRSLDYRRSLVLSMKSQLVNSTAAVAGLNAALYAEIEANLTSIYGSDKGRLDSTVYDSVAQPKIAARGAEILDPLNLAERIRELDAELETYDTTLDFTLSESNARTEIEVDL